MGYLIDNGLLQISGTLSVSQVNSLGSVPFVFSTPGNFVPIFFALTAISGITPPTFTSNLHIETVNINRPVLIGSDPQNINSYTFFGQPLRPVVTPTHGVASNIDLLPNNYQLTPIDTNDPIPGDYTYKYNLIGTILK
jgi:hypothetical protein